MVVLGLPWCGVSAGLVGVVADGPAGSLAVSGGAGIGGPAGPVDGDGGHCGVPGPSVVARAGWAAEAGYQLRGRRRHRRGRDRRLLGQLGPPGHDERHPAAACLRVGLGMAGNGSDLRQVATPAQLLRGPRHGVDVAGEAFEAGPFEMVDDRLQSPARCAEHRQPLLVVTVRLEMAVGSDIGAHLAFASADHHIKGRSAGRVGCHRPRRVMVDPWARSAVMA